MGGDYYTLAEAAEFIASKTGKKKNIKNVLLDAKRGKIRLCTWFDGTLYKFNYDIKGTGKLQSIDGYKFSGYIQIPGVRITPEGGEIQLGGVTLIEVVDVWASNRDPRTLDDNELSDRYFDQQYDGYLPQNLYCNLDDALVPEQDLDDLIVNQHKEIKQPIHQHQQPIPGKLPNTTMGRLAVKVAWELECELRRKASADEVIKRLQHLVVVKKEEILIKATSHGVMWITTTYKEKEYDKLACSKTLKSWHKSRAIQNLGLLNGI